MLIPGGILLVIAIGATVQRLRVKNTVLSALRPNTRIKVENLASELNIREADVKGAIVDLRTEGRIKATFDHATGEVVIGTRMPRTPSPMG
jgi:hypothetical protein